MRIAFDTPTILPGNKNGTRKKLCFRNAGANTVQWSWQALDPDGIPLAAGTTPPFGEGMVLDGTEQRINTDIYLTPIGGPCLVFWTELT